MIISFIYFTLILVAFKYIKCLQVKNAPNWTMSLAFIIKTTMGLFFSYIYIYHTKNPSEPSDAIRFLDESKQLYAIFFQSKSDFFAMFTGIGDNANMIHKYMNKSFIWDAGNFTMINDSRNTIRFHCLIRFISFNSTFVHTLVLCALSLIGIQQLQLAFQPYSKLKPIYLFSILLLFPSLLFWSSGILKEPFLILGIGIFSRACLIKENKYYRLLLLTIGFCILLLFKPYILICLFPAIGFYIAFKYIFKERIKLTVFAILLVVTTLILLFPSKRQRFTEYISRKQFDLENVGEGGIHVYGETCFYYFKPSQYKNLRIKDGFAELVKTSEAFELSWIDTKTIPKHVLLNPNGKKWKIHIIMPGTNSYIKTTSIDNSFIQLIKNIPEAIINVLFRPFPFDNGSFLKYPAMFEAWLISLFILLSLVFRRKIDSNSKGIIFGLLIFAFSLILLIGWTTPVIGAIVRFRFPAQLALLLIGAILIDSTKIFKKIIHE